LKNYLKTADTDWYKQRIFGALLCVLAAFVVIFLRLVYLQVIMGEEYRRLSVNNSIRLQNIDPPRGLIVDGNGVRLAENRPSFDVSITIKDAGDLKETIGRLAGLLDEDPGALMARINSQKGLAVYKPILLKRDIGREALALIEVNKYDLPGVMVDVKLRRHYLREKSAAHVIGYLSEINSTELKSGDYPGLRRGDYIGKCGVERALESVLRGERGGRQVEVNANGQVVRILKTVQARPGLNAHLTIRQPLQQLAEELLEGVAGAIAALDPENGHVLALASNPSFDQNAFAGGLSYDQWNALVTDPFRPMENKAIQGEYPPGSTYKIVTAIAGLEEGVIDEQTEIDCYGYHRFGNRIYRCWKRGGHGRVDIYRALAESCDVFFYQVGQKLGVDRLAWYANACGLGHKTGIDIDQEAQGLIPTAAWKKARTGTEWQPGETLSVAIGQGFNLATPLQMAALAAAVGNGGIRYKTTVWDSIRNWDGETVSFTRPQPIGKLPASERTLAIVRRGLWQAVNGERGTAGRIRSPSIPISGKTGTSQVVSRRSADGAQEEELPSHLRPHAWFVAYAPSERPRIAVAVLVEHGEHGSGAAAPIARELIRTYLHGLDRTGPVAGTDAGTSPGGEG